MLCETCKVRSGAADIPKSALHWIESKAPGSLKSPACAVCVRAAKAAAGKRVRDERGAS
jgi:hypothetical protein